jgi:hypothetical protein
MRNASSHHHTAGLPTERAASDMGLQNRRPARSLSVAGSSQHDRLDAEVISDAVNARLVDGQLPHPNRVLARGSQSFDCKMVRANTRAPRRTLLEAKCQAAN